MSIPLPRIIFITGIDGSGKSLFARWLQTLLTERGIKCVLIWSRFHNYLSKPFLALTRITGHNYYRNFDGTRFGFHDFASLGIMRYAFALTQALDVNIATYLHIRRLRKRGVLLVCERGPWDTLVDVAADTGLDGLIEGALGNFYVRQVKNEGVVLLLKRKREAILESRPELIHDYKLGKRLLLYESLAERHDWRIIDNNGSMEETKKQIVKTLDLPYEEE